ncbi:hypothetical protein [Yoonia sp. R78084]|uniref:hypothetical protein n=1 Tax=Yoonia sp. R78084 TaxID=3093869 RepID=UPI0037DD3A73
MSDSYIELTINDTSLKLPLGMAEADLPSLLVPRKYLRNDDPEMQRTSFQLPDDGVEIIFQNGALRGVFLYLASSDNGQPVFTGSTNFLSEAFFRAPSPHLFEVTLAASSFARSARQYPNAIDMLTDKTRLRYETRPDQSIIYFDSGASLRTGSM